MEKISKLAKILIKLLEKILYSCGVSTRRSSEDFGVGTCSAS
jgi:hypothetical protein